MFNSLLIERAKNANFCQGLLLFPCLPTDWSSFYTSLKLGQGINVEISGKKKKIVTPDLQLYAKCIQLREYKDICKNYIFRPGELHIIFAMMKVFGKYTDVSGLERLFIEAEIYGKKYLETDFTGKASGARNRCTYDFLLSA